MGTLNNDEHPIQELNSILLTDRSGADVNVKDRWGDPIIAIAVRNRLRHSTAIGSNTSRRECVGKTMSILFKN